MISYLVGYIMINGRILLSSYQKEPGYLGKSEYFTKQSFLAFIESNKTRNQRFVLFYIFISATLGITFVKKIKSKQTCFIAESV